MLVKTPCRHFYVDKSKKVLEVDNGEMYIRMYNVQMYNVQMYNVGLACNTLCKCKECANPYGAKPPKLHVPTKERNRHHHHMQVEIPWSKRFAVDRGEVVSEAIWSSFECIVLDELCKSPDVESADFPKLYNSIVCYSTCNFCTMPLQDDVLFWTKQPSKSRARLNTMLNMQRYG